MTTLETLLTTALETIADECNEASLAQHIDAAKAALHHYDVATRAQRTLACDLLATALEIIATDIFVNTIKSAQEEAHAGLENAKNAAHWDAARLKVAKDLELHV